MGLAALALPPGTVAEDVLIFGEPDEPAAEPEDRPDADPSPWRYRLERAQLEGGQLTAGDRSADYSHHGTAEAYMGRDLGSGWEVRLGARLDGHLQGGGERSGVSRLDADYGENWLRYRAPDWRLTVGTQRVLWGRVDEIPPTDRLSTKDFTRFALDEMVDRRRTNPAVRLELYQGDWDIDMLFLPVFREAELPDRDSIWHPVDRERGRLFGLPEDPALVPVIQQARIDDDSSGDGGGGVRISRSGAGVDYAFTVQRARQSQPYYRVDDATRAALAAGSAPAQRATLHAEHPRSWVVGADLATEVGAWTLRAEAAWLSDVPVTRAADLRYETVEGFDWVVGVEGFPGDRDFRTTLQLAGQHLHDAGGVLDAREAYYLTGELENPFLDHQWRGRLRFSAGLDRRDAYVNPELAWTGNEPHEVYVGLHWLDGREDTAAGFYRDNRLLVLGWRGQF
ncbi:hypothetical protein DFR31_1550 [Alkalispirillum mobile]|uniref:Uncharacterized protein n=1 Tax=Alkalispirillum mobile TaxID=85925 RepID=A0A498CAN4_9GAMM|nr:hypothetical protein [Alkalispirillum mobile]RLK51606.1 hypothetical protein DFR31_1550 [Alkalispirillum mobile]